MSFGPGKDKGDPRSGLLSERSQSEACCAVLTLCRCGKGKTVAQEKVSGEREEGGVRRSRLGTLRAVRLTPHTSVHPHGKHNTGSR